MDRNPAFSGRGEAIRPGKKPGFLPRTVSEMRVLDRNPAFSGRGEAIRPGKKSRVSSPHRFFIQKNKR
ncbi:Uncharacterized protein dnm_058330 [Desulfonema magnum]|uniref:Uncharacterized protein n=1 Tax=Desulfonema magnum TaxID=45655 RepID=A0A975BQE7_9BACT|nr:Uncharacterized protein dnm_058330 [Desulfonema magnum]